MPQDRRCCWTPAEAAKACHQKECNPPVLAQVPGKFQPCLRLIRPGIRSGSARPASAAECCACIAAADPQLLNQHGDVEPGRAALLNLSHQHQLLAVWHGGPDPASLAKAHLNARDVCDLQAGANCSRALALDQGSAGSPARLSVLTRVAGDCSSAAPRRHAVSLLSWSGRRGVPVPLC